MLARNNYYRWCNHNAMCKANDTPPSGTAAHRYERRAAHKLDRRTARAAVRREVRSAE